MTTPSTQNNPPGAARQAGCRQCATRSLCLFAAANDADLAAIEPHIRAGLVDEGGVLLHQGERSGILRIVKSGQVMAVHETPCGHQLPLCVAGRGSPVGLLGLFGLPVGFTAQAIGPVHVCDIAVGLVRRGPWWEQRLMAQAMHMAHGHLHRLADWSAAAHHPQTMAKLVASLMLMQRDAGDCHFRLPPGRTLALLLGLSRESVSRHLAVLEGSGYLSRTGNHMARFDSERACELVKGKGPKPDAASPAQPRRRGGGAVKAAPAVPARP